MIVPQSFQDYMLSFSERLQISSLSFGWKGHIPIYRVEWWPLWKQWLPQKVALFVLQSSLVSQMVKNLLAMQQTWVRSLGQEDPPEKGMAAHSHILAWRIPWSEGPGGLQSIELQRVGHDWVTKTFTLLVKYYWMSSQNSNKILVIFQKQRHNFSLLFRATQLFKIIEAEPSIEELCCYFFSFEMRHLDMAAFLSIL